MRIAVIGGTGVAGRPTTVEAARRGHEVVVVGRHAPRSRVPGTEFAAADVTTGAGLDAALRGVDVVIDAANVMSQRERTATEFFVGSTRRLVAAEAAAGVGRHVLLSIVGIDDVPTGYYRAKVAQERAAREGTVPVSVVRATQFHEFAGQVLAMTTKGPIAVMPAIPVQPVSTRDVAAALLDAAESPDAVPMRQIGGPERHELVDLARRTLRAHGRKVLVVPLHVPGKAGKAMRAGHTLLTNGHEGTETFDDWLRTPS
jgi:uncharacterized protein YbjT (DUF2867 family)